MPVPTNGWINGGWNNKSTPFYLMAEILGLQGPISSPDELQDLFARVSSAKVFAENVHSFVVEANSLGFENLQHVQQWAASRLEHIERELGLLEPLPFMSLRGWTDPRVFEGVAIWPAGIMNWMFMRHEEILKAHMAGAQFKRVIVMSSSRKLNTPADLRHPYLKYDPVGEDEWQSESEVMQDIHEDYGDRELEYVSPVLPRAQKDGSPLSLQMQLEYLINSGQHEELIGDLPIYVPSTPNSLYVPLHVKRVLGRDNVWFSQAGARLVKTMPPYWWPGLQDVMTTPNGILRLWVELLHAGCITNDKAPR